MFPPSGRWEPLLQQWLGSINKTKWCSLYQVASRLDRRHFRRYHFRPYRRKERVAPSITKAVGYGCRRHKLRQREPPPFQWMVMWGMIAKQPWLPRRERFISKAKWLKARWCWRRLIAQLHLRQWGLAWTNASKHVAQRRWWQMADRSRGSARRLRRFVRLFQHLLLQVARWRWFCSALPLLCTRRRIRRIRSRGMQRRWSHIVARLLRMGRTSQYYRVLEIRFRLNATRLTGRQRATMLRRRRRRDVKLVFAAWVLTYAQQRYNGWRRRLRRWTRWWHITQRVLSKQYRRTHTLAKACIRPARSQWQFAWQAVRVHPARSQWQLRRRVRAAHDLMRPLRLTNSMWSARPAPLEPKNPPRWKWSRAVDMTIYVNDIMMDNLAALAGLAAVAENEAPPQSRKAKPYNAEMWPGNVRRPGHLQALQTQACPGDVAF